MFPCRPYSGPGRRSFARLWSWADVIILMVFPSTKESTDTSRPVINSSTTISVTCRAELLIQHQGLDAVFCLFPGIAYQYALSQRKAVRFEHNGHWRMFNVKQGLFSGESNVSYPAVGILYFFIRSLENALDPSRMAAFFLGPERPVSRLLQMHPPPLLPAGRQDPRLPDRSHVPSANATWASKSITPISTHSATWAIPALPGAQYSFSTLGLCAAFHGNGMFTSAAAYYQHLHTMSSFYPWCTILIT